MKKVLIVINKANSHLYEKAFVEYAKTKGIDVDIFFVDEAKNSFRGVHRLLFKVCKNKKKKFYAKQKEILYRKIKKSDTVLFYNLFYDDGYLIDEENILRELETKNSKLYFVDTCKGCQQPLKFLNVFNDIFVFENQDIDYLHKEYGLVARLIPSGTTYYLYKDRIDNNPKKYDICFVGLSSPKRLEYLENVAEYCSMNNKSFYCAGHFWHNTNLLQRILGELKFRIKHPSLYRYVKNEYILPCDVARLYSESKISLNINISKHKGLNQRAFDIMYSGSLLVCDQQELGQSVLKDKTHMIMCQDAADMVSMIDFYLNNDVTRNKIIEDARKMVNDNYLMISMFDRMLG